MKLKTHKLEIEIENLKRQQKIFESKGKIEESIKLAIRIVKINEQLNKEKEDKWL